MAEFSNEEHLSGLARDIRSSVDSEQLDLGGYTEQRTHDLVKAAFSTPLTAPTEMVKFTFVVGGGKLVRSRYSDDLTKWMVAALRDIGFSEDRSAAETFDSQGTFKQQHDTGQNLKYLIVYPHVACANKKSCSSGSAAPAPTVDQNSPEYILLASEFATFQEVVASKIGSYKQKKRALKILQDDLDEFKRIEEKLVAGNLLTPKEQAQYDSNSGNSVEKIAFLLSEIKASVDNGQLTKGEKEELLSTLDTNLAAVDAEINEAKAENKPKKVEKLEEKKKTITARRAVVDKITPIAPHRLRYGEDIQKLHMRLFPLLALEERGRSCSLTLADLKILEEKSDLEDALRSYERNSRGWLEDESDFLAKCANEEKEAKARYNARVKAKSGSAGSGAKKTGTVKINNVGLSRPAASSSNWSTAKKPASSSNSAGSVAKKPAAGGFAAAFGDSDSD